MERYKILVVDDDYIARQLIIIMLEDKNEYDIDTACDGQLALDMVKKNEYDIILMDKNMPIMGGVESATKIKKLYPDLPIMSISAYYWEPNETMFDDHLQKPFNREMLNKKIMKLVN